MVGINIIHCVYMDMMGLISFTKVLKSIMIMHIYMVFTENIMKSCFLAGQC